MTTILAYLTLFALTLAVAALGFLRLRKKTRLHSRTEAHMPIRTVLNSRLDALKNEEPRSDYGDGSDDEEEDSARWRAEQRLKVADDGPVYD